MDQLQNSLLGTLKASMDRLLQGLLADVVSLDALPKDLLERWLNADGVYRVQAFPEEPQPPRESQGIHFGCWAVSINATDLPVIYLESQRSGGPERSLGFACNFCRVACYNRNIKDGLILCLC